MTNPFTPLFGMIPPYLAGRDYLVQEILQVLDSWSGNPDRTSILVGPRGTGKTATLGYLSNEAESKGWISTSVTAIPGMLEEILQQAYRRSSHIVSQSGDKKLSGVALNVAGYGASFAWENNSNKQHTWRTKITELLESLKTTETGLLITVDEVDPKLDELVQLVSTYQHLIIENYKVVLLMAGLPHKVSLLLNGKSVSFLRRAARKEIGNISDYELEAAFRITADMGGKQFSKDALKIAVQESHGFPFMFQLVGYRSWVESANREEITAQDVINGSEIAGKEMKERVLKSSLDELSNKDLLFLQAMLEDDKCSTTSTIAQRIESSVSVAGKYRRRLLDQGIILQNGRSSFCFALPMLRKYLPEYIKNYC